jgi:hypothetical protein
MDRIAHLPAVIVQGATMPSARLSAYACSRPGPARSWT